MIRGWLGHVSLETTNWYAEITVRMKEAAMKLCEPAPSDHEPRKGVGETCDSAHVAGIFVTEEPVPTSLT